MRCSTICAHYLLLLSSFFKDIFFISEFVECAWPYSFTVRRSTRVLNNIGILSKSKFVGFTKSQLFLFTYMFCEVFSLCSLIIFIVNLEYFLKVDLLFKFAVGSCDPIGPKSDSQRQGWNLGVRSTQVKVSPSILSGLLTRSFSLLGHALARVHMQRSMRGSKAHPFELSYTVSYSFDLSIFS